MPIDRYFYDGPLVEGALIELDPDEQHHLKVTRVRVGESVDVVNGKNLLAKAKVQEKSLLIEHVKKEAPLFNITLVQGIAKLNRLEWVIEKGCELGMSRLILFPGDRSEKVTFSKQQEERMRRLLIGAMKQCGRLDLPEIQIVPPLQEWQKFPTNGYFGDVDEGAPLFAKVWKKREETTFFVGPESGFSEKEKKVLKNHGIQGVKLHPYILRTETAPIVALSLISHWMSH